MAPATSSQAYRGPPSRFLLLDALELDRTTGPIPPTPVARRAQRIAHLRLDLRCDVRTLRQADPGVLLSLAETHVAIREPAARLVEAAVLHAEFDEQARM